MKKNSSTSSWLLVCPPAHFGSQAEKFTAYFQGRGLVEFMYGDKHYTISIEDVACYPQAYAAAATMLHALLDDPKAVVLILEALQRIICC